MPRRAKLDSDVVWARICRALVRGPASAADLARWADISQPSFARLAAQHDSELLRAGRARATRYALLRQVTDISQPLPIYEIDTKGRSHQLAELNLVFPGGCYVRGAVESVSSEFFGDQPYFLHDLRPSGFLGRLVPDQHPELQLPADVRLWSGEQTLRYLSKFGSDAPGNLIVGDGALARYRKSVVASNVVPVDQRLARYPQLAADVLGATPPGSSAGGEQPKFLVSLDPDPIAVLVKFSPPTDTAVGRRYADLLVAEHVAHQVLARANCAAARSELLEAESRIFLQVTRFDRTPEGGRRGVISFEALDAEFVGKGTTWSDIARALGEQRRLDADAVQEVEWREQFGAWIGNTDMHPGNLSLFTVALRPAGLAPVYDMVPMQYAPHQGNLVTRPLVPAKPHPRVADVWADAGRVARTFWETLARHPLLSDAFQRTAMENAALVDRTLQDFTH
ncbi:MAG: type II toxin-antitoxin system HipA family toxin YjjJ [Polyangiaceae bacterium]